MTPAPPAPLTRRAVALFALCASTFTGAPAWPQAPDAEPAAPAAPRAAPSTPIVEPPRAAAYGFCVAASNDGGALFLSDVIGGMGSKDGAQSEARWRAYLGDRLAATDAVLCVGGLPSRTLSYAKRDAAASQMMSDHGLGRRVYTGWSGG